MAVRGPERVSALVRGCARFSRGASSSRVRPWGCGAPVRGDWGPRCVHPHFLIQHRHSHPEIERKGSRAHSNSESVLRGGAGVPASEGARHDFQEGLWGLWGQLSSGRLVCKGVS